MDINNRGMSRFDNCVDEVDDRKEKNIIKHPFYNPSRAQTSFLRLCEYKLNHYFVVN